MKLQTKLKIDNRNFQFSTIFFKSQEENVNHIEDVFGVLGLLMAAGMTLKLKTDQCFSKLIDYIGHMIVLANYGLKKRKQKLPSRCDDPKSFPN